MKFLFFILFTPILAIGQLKYQNMDFKHYPIYEGRDLGLTYSINQSTFKVWAPTAKKVALTIYENNEDTIGTIFYMLSDGQSTLPNSWVKIWSLTLPGNWLNKFYTFKIFIDGKWNNEVTDPYAKAVGLQGKKAKIIDLYKTNPVDWEKDKLPIFLHLNDAIIYELHVRDASIALNSGILNKGKFLGLTEIGTKSPEGEKTGLDHLIELGVTHIHLLPIFDFNSVDESLPNNSYNWGYDPLNYNVPEGSYATINDAATRIKEFKQLVQTFHKNGLRVIMDVVYNHTALTDESNFNQLVPGYYYRQSDDGKFSNGTGCNNETASERFMFRKFMLESMEYWVNEFHVDGFRVDLMAIHDIETMNLISNHLQKIKPSILIYGEGWTAGNSPLKDDKKALKKNVSQLNRIAVFSDDMRDAIKGSVFDALDKGFASGKLNMEESIKFGIVASCFHPQINYELVNYSKAPYAKQPWQTITYCECHDNNTLWDKLSISNPLSNELNRIEMHKLALSIVLTSQGISFLHAGTEFLRTKQNVENSFKSPDSINEINWQRKHTYNQVMKYVQYLIQIRKNHPSFRMQTASQIELNLHFLNNQPKNVIAYTINGRSLGDSWHQILVIFNGNAASQMFNNPLINSVCVVKNNKQANQKINSNTITLAPFSCNIFYKN